MALPEDDLSVFPLITIISFFVAILMWLPSTFIAATEREPVNSWYVAFMPAIRTLKKRHDRKNELNYFRRFESYLMRMEQEFFAHVVCGSLCKYQMCF